MPKMTIKEIETVLRNASRKILRGQWRGNVVITLTGDDYARIIASLIQHEHKNDGGITTCQSQSH